MSIGHDYHPTLMTGNEGGWAVKGDPLLHRP
jgi:hypothetical protein